MHDHRQDPNAARGAKNIISRCLAVTAGERVHVLTYRADDIYPLIARSIEDVGATPNRVEVEPIEARASNPDDYAAILTPMLAGATATLFLAPVRPSGALSFAIINIAQSVRARHLHLLQVDERLLGQSFRADPEPLAIINERLCTAVKPPCIVRVSSDAGTELEVRLAAKHPLISSSGRPVQGVSENLPAGAVYTHPARISGTLVVDRAIFGPAIDADRAALRRSPVHMKFEGGRLVSHETSDRALAHTVDKYLESHAHASRVGLVFFPTNYLVRSEVGIDLQDRLLPGVNVALGCSASEKTHATFDAPVQMVLLGRRQTVDVDGRKLFDAGRVAQSLVEGIDPFR